MSTDSRPRWFIRDVVPGDVTIREPGGDDSFPFRATVLVTATIINGSGGRREVRFEAFAGFVDPENIGDAVTLVVKGGIQGARAAATAFCEAANADVEARNQGDQNRLGAELAEAADEDRVAKLRAMSDQAVIEHAVRGGTVIGPEASNLVVLTGGILRVLREAGFSREEPKQKIEFIFPEGQHIKIYGDHVSLGAVKAHLCDGIPGIKYSKGT